MTVRKQRDRAPLIILILLSLTMISGGCQEKKPQIRIGDTPPGFTLKDLSGGDLRMPEEGRGKVVVIRFWADWCASCREEMPAMDTVYNRYKDKGLVILAVNVKQSQAVAESFAKELSLSYPVLLDPDASAAKAYGVKGLPTTFILDRQGRVKEKILGDMEKDEFERMVKGLL